MAPLVLAIVGLLVLLWIVMRVRRGAIKTTLLTSGTQVRGASALVWPRGSGAARIAVTYEDNNGVSHTAVKSLVSAGDGELIKLPAQVIFHPLRADRDDYVLLGFGAMPSTWFRASFARR